MKLALVAFVALMWLGIVTVGVAMTAPPSCDLECLELKKLDLQAELALVEYRIDQLSPLIEEAEESDDFWLSLDLGQDFATGLYTSMGISAPLGPVTASTGYWWGSDDYTFKRDSNHHGFYVTFGYSWTLIK